MEERLEEAGTSAPLSSPHSWEDMGSLVLWCRNAAALQPDGTRVPVVRCEVGVFLAQCSSACRLAGIEVPQDLIGSVAMQWVPGSLHAAALQPDGMQPLVVLREKGPWVGVL